MAEKVLAELKRTFKVLMIFSIIALSAAGGSYFTEKLHLSPAVEVSENSESSPMIDKETVSLYKSGDISKDTATSRIGSRLDSLVKERHIKGWVFEDSSSMFRITMNNGAVFVFYLS